MSSSTKPSLLSDLRVSGPVWLASDIHLGSHNPRTCQAFYEFLAHARNQTNALILLGDIFEVWLGDDWTKSPEPWLQTAIHHLHQTAHAIPLWIMGGNRDFLIGADFAHQLGARFLPAQVILEVQPNKHPTKSQCLTISCNHSQRFLLAHGDEFCTADLGYQRLRRIVRTNWIQQAFLKLPLSVRQRIAQRMRNTSQNMERSDDDGRYDVQDNPLRTALLEHKLTSMIHGHTHQPGHYRIPPKHAQTTSKRHLSHQSSQNCFDRWVLPDWECDHLPQNAQARGGWLEITDSAMRLYALNQLPQNTK
ncbi:UDP-2,3-diacylglucosamine diphosphatase [Orrella sp. 11846]|uniref:UDP-2,3-diacylglucosamine diphosphatase n=1 Tax=Orrella sp. 11846 TaxID=3409913 RepID=UPI003B5A48D0